MDAIFDTSAPAAHAIAPTRITGSGGGSAATPPGAAAGGGERKHYATPVMEVTSAPPRHGSGLQVRRRWLCRVCVCACVRACVRVCVRER